MSDLITSNIKGIGGKGIELLCASHSSAPTHHADRRLQAYSGFEFLAPFADDRSLEAVEEFGVSADSAEDLAETIKTHREALNIGSDETDLHKALAIVLDRAIALSLDRLVGAAKKVRASDLGLL